MFICQVCQKNYQNKTMFLKHICSDDRLSRQKRIACFRKQKIDPYCKRCNKQFRTQSMYKKHVCPITFEQRLIHTQFIQNQRKIRRSLVSQEGFGFSSRQITQVEFLKTISREYGIQELSQREKLNLELSACQNFSLKPIDHQFKQFLQSVYENPQFIRWKAQLKVSLQKGFKRGINGLIQAFKVSPLGKQLVRVFNQFGTCLEEFSIDIAGQQIRPWGKYMLTNMNQPLKKEDRLLAIKNQEMGQAKLEYSPLKHQADFQEEKLSNQKRKLQDSRISMKDLKHQKHQIKHQDDFQEEQLSNHKRKLQDSRISMKDSKIKDRNPSKRIDEIQSIYSMSFQQPNQQKSYKQYPKYHNPNESYISQRKYQRHYQDEQSEDVSQSNSKYGEQSQVPQRKSYLNSNSKISKYEQSLPMRQDSDSRFMKRINREIDQDINQNRINRNRLRQIEPMREQTPRKSYKELESVKNEDQEIDKIEGRGFWGKIFNFMI